MALTKEDLTEIGKLLQPIKEHTEELRENFKELKQTTEELKRDTKELLAVRVNILEDEVRKIKAHMAFA